MRTSSLICIATFLAGCAATMDAMTPSTSVIKDEFDGKMIVRQPPVNAASSMSEAFHTLGFEWTEKFPDSIFITVGFATDYRNIQDVAFNVDGKIIDKIKTASALTDHQYTGTFRSSYRRFEMGFDDFQMVANGKDVKMRVGGINEYTVSSFGPSAGHGVAIVNTKFVPFLDQVRPLRRKP
ncbi:MAG TPA: hypothetical protein VGA25_06440 [Burkholderiales bacterium]